MRRLPIYFLIDISESMVGEPIQQVQEGMKNIIQELRTDPYALETAFVSIIAFAGRAKVLTPLTELYKFYPPTFPIGSGTSLGAGLECLMDDMDRSLQKTTMEMKGDWKPIVFLFTDGVPTDNPSRAFDRWNAKYRRQCNLVAISLGDNADTSILGGITDTVLRLNETDEHSFKQFFRWVTASIKTQSVSVSEQNSDELQLPSTSGINLEKVDGNKPCMVDENFVVIVGKCQTTGRPYLIKFAKRMKTSGTMFEGMEAMLVQYYKLVGSYPIDEESYNELSESDKSNHNINTQELIGQPTCPCCGNQLGMVICECGNVFCVGEDMHSRCPWCGLEGTLSQVEGSGMDINRGRG